MQKYSDLKKTADILLGQQVYKKISQKPNKHGVADNALIFLYQICHVQLAPNNQLFYVLLAILGIRVA